MLTEAPIKPITETTLNRLDRMIGERLIEIVPQPVEQNMEEVKNLLIIYCLIFILSLFTTFRI